MEVLLPLIAAWLSAGYGLPVPTSMPHVMLVAPETLTEVMQPSTGGKLMSGELVAAYRDDLETIFISTDGPLDPVVESSVIVHEMVHHMQNAAGMRYPCMGLREALAYQAQADWLAQFGLDLEGAFGVDPLTLKLRTSCPPP